MTRRRLVVAACLAAAGTLLSGCGGTVPQPATRPAALPAAVVTSRTPLLVPGAVPGLAVTTHPLTADLLAKDAPMSDLRSRLDDDAYLGGRERTFQGPSRRLTLVTSRALVFAGADGARHFLDYVHAHAAQWFGFTTEVSPLTSSGRAGWLFRPPLCACHLANPVLVGIVQQGDRLTWLEINGPQATVAVLRTLLEPARSSAT